VIGQLQFLTFLSCASNAINSTLPSQVGLLTALTALYFERNPGIFGTIPTTFSLLTNLQYINLFGDSLSGVVPRINYRPAVAGVSGFWYDRVRSPGGVPLTARICLAI
jgi:Leucine-rich repeat (LRR) protein